MPDGAPAGAAPAPELPRPPARGFATTLRKRWRLWLRAVHRDVGYLAVGFTVIYAVSGIAMNHLDDWDPNFVAREATYEIAALPDELDDAEAVRRIAAATGVSGAPSDVFRAGDEVRLRYPDGTQVTAIATTVTVQHRRDRVFFRVVDWLHAARGKPAWKFLADAYAVLLLYLAISGVFMIKGKLGLRWRGAALIALGLTGPIGYLIVSGGPGAPEPDRADRADRPGEVERPAPRPASPGGMRPLPRERMRDGMAPLPAEGR